MEENQINQNQGENIPPIVLETEKEISPIISNAPIEVKVENDSATSQKTEPIVQFTDISNNQEVKIQEKPDTDVKNQAAEPVLESMASAVNPEEKKFDGGKAVLLVEDDAFLNSLMKNKLEKSGVSVNLVTDGEEALKILENFKPKLVLLDLILPKRSGFEVLEAMQSNPQLNQIPVIILSNLGQESDVAKGRQLGAIEYFIKAKTSIDELVLKVEGYLEGKQ